MNNQYNGIRIGLFLVIAGLLFGIFTGIGFGIAEDVFKEYISQGVNLNPTLHDSASLSKIWRYALRAHFHETGISAISLGLIILIMLSDMSLLYKRLSSIAVGLGVFYPLSWFNMFLIAPSIGRDAAHHDITTQLFIYIGVTGLLAGITLIMIHILTGRISSERE